MLGRWRSAWPWRIDRRWCQSMWRWRSVLGRWVPASSAGCWQRLLGETPGSAAISVSPAHSAALPPLACTTPISKFHLASARHKHSVRKKQKGIGYLQMTHCLSCITLYTEARSSVKRCKNIPLCLMNNGPIYYSECPPLLNQIDKRWNDQCATAKFPNSRV